jgi:hypothetical protein
MTAQRAGWAYGEAGSSGQWLTIVGSAHQRPVLHPAREAAEAALDADPRLKSNLLVDIEIAYVTEVRHGGVTGNGLAYRITDPPPPAGGPAASAQSPRPGRRTRLQVARGPHKQVGDARTAPVPARAGIIAHDDHLAPTACGQEITTTLVTLQDPTRALPGMPSRDERNGGLTRGRCQPGDQVRVSCWPRRQFPDSFPRRTATAHRTAE